MTIRPFQPVSYFARKAVSSARVFGLVCIMLFASPLKGGIAANAADIRDLIAESASLEYGPSMPVNSSFRVRLAEDLPTQGEYIKEFWIDQDTGKFIANVISDMGDVDRVWGVATLIISIPVPNRRILPDEIIAAEDLEMVEMPWARVNAFAVTDLAGLENMQVRRMLNPGRPVLQQSVILPIIISRGERVTIELKYGGLQLASEGKAISDAHLGQEVRVVNLSSNKTIVGIARGDGVVEAIF